MKTGESENPGLARHPKVAAAYLAKSGKSVCVLERRHVLGGCATTEELWPGFKISVAAYVISLLLPEIIRDLRLGEFDVLVGINLLREGLDMPEVSLVAILDADKEGFLRSDRALIQTIGRAARNINGMAILYADRVTGSMQRAIDETDRRREKQIAYNLANNITPKGIQKTVTDVMDVGYASASNQRVRRFDKVAEPSRVISIRSPSAWPKI